jgi:16S rRNA (guanine966-N2)-methyltransferase
MSGFLRITGGYLGRQRIRVPAAADEGLVRPAQDRVREAIFSALGSATQDARVLDLFGGSGALSFESLSRGAKRATIVEYTKATAKNIEDNTAGLGVQKQCEILVGDALKLVTRFVNQQFDLIFLDPPYALLLPDTFFDALVPLLAPDGIVVLRYEKKDQRSLPVQFELLRDRSYGSSRVLFLTRKVN